jgi:AcrR family transcriptional regulator
MITRAESAAATRQALLDSAAALLDIGGPDAVTLREVTARAGISRTAPYRHFADKDRLLTALATEAWGEVGDALEMLVGEGDLSPKAALRTALLSLVALARQRPHLYQLMFSTPAGDPTAAVRAAERSHDLFLEIVGTVVGRRRAKQYGALLLTSAHGIAALELSGHLVWDKWQIDSEGIVDLVITSVADGDVPAE